MTDKLPPPEALEAIKRAICADRGYCKKFPACGECSDEALAAWNEALPHFERMVAEWLRGEATVCDCFAREENECACGAWDNNKSMPVNSLVDAIASGAWRQESGQ